MMRLEVAQLRYKYCNGKRYCICMKNTTMVRCQTSNLYDLASEMFGFVMAGTNVYAYDLEEHRIIKPIEYEKEMQEVIQHQKELPWVEVK